MKALGVPCALIALLVVSHANATEASLQLAYEREPLTIELNVGEERIIEFNEPIELGLPPWLSAQLDVQNVEGSLYLTARHPFTAHRVVVEAVASQRLVLLDVAARRASGKLPRIEIAVNGNLATDQSEPPITVVQLVRYAAQQVYAPQRLIPFHPDIKRVRTTQLFADLYRHPQIESEAIATWKTDRYLILVLELRNLSDTAIDLKPELLRGEWLTLGLTHRRLLPTNKRGATTVVFLVGREAELSNFQA